jgi:hypothetical protein
MDSSDRVNRFAPCPVINPIQLFLYRAAWLRHAPDSWAEMAARKIGSRLYWRPASTKIRPDPRGTFLSKSTGSTERNVRIFPSIARRGNGKPKNKTVAIAHFFIEPAYIDENFIFANCFRVDRWPFAVGGSAFAERHSVLQQWSYKSYKRPISCISRMRPVPSVPQWNRHLLIRGHRERRTTNPFAETKFLVY